MSDLQVQQFNEAIKDLDLPNLITKISKHWVEPRRKQALKILNVLKSSENRYKKLLKEAHPLAEAWAVCKPFTVTFSFDECNIKKGDILAFKNWIEKLIVDLNEEADKTSHYGSHIQAIHWDYNPGDTEAIAHFRYLF